MSTVTISINITEAGLPDAEWLYLETTTELSRQEFGELLIANYDNYPLAMAMVANNQFDDMKAMMVTDGIIADSNVFHFSLLDLSPDEGEIANSEYSFMWYSNGNTTGNWYERSTFDESWILLTESSANSA